MSIEPENVTIDSDYTSIDTWDSLTQIEVIFRIESASGQKFTAKELSEMTGVRNIVEHLEKRGIECETLD